MKDCRVGVIGVGRMGKGLAASYLRAGHTTAVYDVDPAPVAELAALGAEPAASTADLAAHSDTISVAVRDEHQLASAAYGPKGFLATIRPGTIVILHTTTPAADSRRLAAAAAEHQAQVLEATMTGGTDGAAAGQLTLMIGGDAGLLEECWPLLRCVAKQRIHVGDLGTAGLVKAIQDTLYGVHHQAAHEMLKLAVAAGVAPDRFFEALGAKGWVLDQWYQYWSADGTTELRQNQSNPRVAPTHLGYIVWSAAEELGVDVTTNEQTIARSETVLKENRGQA